MQYSVTNYSLPLLRAEDTVDFIDVSDVVIKFGIPKRSLKVLRLYLKIICLDCIITSSYYFAENYWVAILSHHISEEFTYFSFLAR